MKRIDIEEQKKILVEILIYIDSICRKYDIKYTLVGGSLIGCIRHKGIIPWDDDIDIGLTHDNYVKLIDILKEKENDRYLLLDSSIRDDYYYPYAKVVDTRTTLFEENMKEIKDYGVYLDIFEYNKFPSNKILSKIQYNKMFILKRWLGINNHSQNFKRNEKNIIKRIRFKLLSLIGNERLLKWYKNTCHKYNEGTNTKSILSWPCYGIDKEIQEFDSFSEYIDGEFESKNIMISKNYDNILTTTFGNYMIPPPKEQQKPHHITNIYWKD